MPRLGRLRNRSRLSARYAEQKYRDDIRALFVPAPAWFGGYPATDEALAQN